MIILTFLAVKLLSGKKTKLEVDDNREQRVSFYVYDFWGFFFHINGRKFEAYNLVNSHHHNLNVTSISKPVSYLM